MKQRRERQKSKIQERTRNESLGKLVFSEKEQQFKRDLKFMENRLRVIVLETEEEPIGIQSYFKTKRDHIEPIGRVYFLPKNE